MCILWTLGLVCIGLEFGEAADGIAFHAAVQSIRSDDLQRHVDVLADDTFEGRAAGSRGGRAAGNYLIQLLKEHGLRGGGDDGAFHQSFRSNRRNILAILDGSDPELKHQFVIVGGHYDHVGYGNKRNSFGPFGYVHNGADDNASGVSGVLETIEAFTMLAAPPKRSVLFALWDDEEQGMLGSKHWASRPTVPINDIVSVINLDMIGRLRNRSLKVIGTPGRRTGLRRLVSWANRETDLQLEFTWKMKAESDHYTFYSRSIPVLMLHTGLHNNYHRPSDDPHLINAEGMQEVSQLLFQVTYDLADRPQRPAYRANSRTESPATMARLEKPALPSPTRLGISWQRESSGEAETAFRIQRVVARTPAARAGLRVGDRLKSFNGWPIRHSDQFRQRLLMAREPIQLVVQRSGEEEPREFQIALAGSPVRLGISLREDSGEPGTVLITRVTPGSPADHAGLRVKDRVYEVAGQSFDDCSEFLELARTTPSPIAMLVERKGQLRQLELRILPEMATEEAQL